jgi:hypothetical protein
MINELEITRLSKQYNLVCSVFPDTIYINSVYRNWICKQNSQGYKLFHVNSGQCKHKNHMHKKDFTDIEKVFQFIHKHDTQIVPDRDRHKRLKFERLFAQIHK